MARIVLVHPDLGIGGAERLMVDAGLALQQKGHNVYFVTTHHDPSHCFLETKDGTLSVTVVGDWLPRSICGRFFAVCAYFRMIYAALYVTFFSDLRPNIILCDLVSVCIPIFKFYNVNVIFYCHFPDLLLSQRGGALKTAYRLPLNWLEEVTTGKADKILVNSKFTHGVFKATFKRLSVNPDIVYPSINTVFFDESVPVPLNDVLKTQLSKESFLFLSVNRYERKKSLDIALYAVHKLKSLLSTDDWHKVHLIMAGGYDVRVTENVEYHDELVKLAADLELTERVTFLKSPSDIEKVSLLHNANCLIYTPQNEHFGIVPLEAMYAGKPVIAANSGGPTETIINNETGLLCDFTPEKFAVAMRTCVQNTTLSKELGEAGRKRVEEAFSFTAFSNKFDAVVENILNLKDKCD